jgi:hypothetical protein
MVYNVLLFLWRLIRPVNTQVQKDNVSPTFTIQCIWCVCLIVRICLIWCNTSCAEWCWWSELVKCISLFNITLKISEWETIFLSFNWFPFSVSLYKKIFSTLSNFFFFFHNAQFWLGRTFLQKHGHSVKDEWILSSYFYS